MFVGFLFAFGAFINHQKINKKIKKNEKDLKNVLDREIPLLSGGELQRFAIAACAIRDTDVYMFDEPSSYLDVKQRLKASRVIRSLISNEEEFRRMQSAKDTGKSNKPAYVIVVEHDLAVLDYLSDFICCLYGTPGNIYPHIYIYIYIYSCVCVCVSLCVCI